MESSSSLEHAVLSCLKQHWGIAVDQLQPLNLGADLEASVYAARALTGATYFVKLKQGHSQSLGARVVEALAQAGLSCVIRPIKTQKGALELVQTQGPPQGPIHTSFTQDLQTQPVGDYTISVFPFMNGQNGFRQALSQEQWYHLGKALRRIHETPLSASLVLELPQVSHTPRWRQAVREIVPLLDKKLSGDVVAMGFQDFMKQQVGTVQRLVSQAEALAEEAQAQKVAHVLCHSDLHAGNILIDEKDDFYIVDWDAPLLAPKERDLLFIGGGVGHVWNKPEEVALFYQGYGKTDVNKTLLAYYRHERILEDIAVYAQSLLLKTEGGPQRAQWLQDCCTQFQPQGVIDIAFKTYENLRL